MPRLLNVLWIASALAVWTAACGPSASNLATPSSVPVPSSLTAQADTALNASGIAASTPGETLHLKVGETFQVRIPTIPRPGFTWQLQDLNARMLTQLGGPVYEPDPGPNAAGGTVVLAFKVVGAGTMPLTLIHASSGIGGVPVLSSNSFGIIIDAR